MVSDAISCPLHNLKTVWNLIMILHSCVEQVMTTRLAKRREILIFPRTVGNTGNYREILVIPGNYWEIGSSPTRKF